MYLSRQLAQLHPALTMPMFSEICHRLQTARPSNIKCLLYYLLPWLYNMELVDPNVCAGAITETDADKNISTGSNCLFTIFLFIIHSRPGPENLRKFRPKKLVKSNKSLSGNLLFVYFQ